MSDVLKSGAVDAVVSAEPILSRIVSSGTGTIVAHYLESLPEKRPQILYASTRAWADANPDTLAAFRKSLVESSASVNGDAAKARGAISHFTKIPMDVLSSMKVSIADPVLSTEQLEWWVDVMEKQNMLQQKPDAATLIQK
jgi:NitT/TauT family transport system substrate-binding protein